MKQKNCFRCGVELNDNNIPSDYEPMYCCPPEKEIGPENPCGCDNYPINPIICINCEKEVENE